MIYPRDEDKIIKDLGIPTNEINQSVMELVHELEKREWEVFMWRLEEEEPIPWFAFGVGMAVCLGIGVLIGVVFGG